jgi:hypothetical protein
MKSGASSSQALKFRTHKFKDPNFSQEDLAETKRFYSRMLTHTSLKDCLARIEENKSSLVPTIYEYCYYYFELTAGTIPQAREQYYTQKLTPEQQDAMWNMFDAILDTVFEKFDHDLALFSLFIKDLKTFLTPRDKSQETLAVPDSSTVSDFTERVLSLLEEKLTTALTNAT